MGIMNHRCSLNAKSECLEWFSSDANVSLKKKKKKPSRGKVQALFWKLRIVGMLPNGKSIKTDSTLCVPVRDYALCLPSGPCHSSCHYLEVVSCSELWTGELFGKGFCPCPNGTGEGGKKVGLPLS